VKPPPFDYVAARSAEEAVDRLAAGGGDAQVLAGGQSLLLELNFRTRRPSVLVDINRVRGFDRLDAIGGVLRVQPLVRHRAFERPVVDGPLGVLLARMARHVAHPPIRARGTMLGSLAYAHPAAEWPALAVTLDAELDLLGLDGRRTVLAGDFFTGPFTTERRPTELLVEARFPVLPREARIGFVEHRRTQASFADLAAIAVLTVHDGHVTDARIGLVSAADRPVRAYAAERYLVGRAFHAFGDAGLVAATEDAAPDGRADLDDRRPAIAVVVRRALEQAALEETAC
jgi:aerobic carbon-monoxide dehydrogenase medium subunit